MGQHAADQPCMEAGGFVIGSQNLPRGASTKSNRPRLVIEGYKTSLAKSITKLPDLLSLSDGCVLGIVGWRTVSTQDGWDN